MGRGKQISYMVLAGVHSTISTYYVSRYTCVCVTYAHEYYLTLMVSEAAYAENKEQRKW